MELEPPSPEQAAEAARALWMFRIGSFLSIFILLFLLAALPMGGAPKGGWGFLIAFQAAIAVVHTSMMTSYVQTLPLEFQSFRLGCFAGAFDALLALGLLRLGSLIEPAFGETNAKWFIIAFLILPCVLPPRLSPRIAARLLQRFKN